MSFGSYNRWVTLSQAPQESTDAPFTDLSPAGVWASIKPQLAGNNARTTEHLVEMWYHPQVTLDTRILYEDPTKPEGKTTRALFVRGIQNVDEQGDTMRLICEEIS